MVDWIPSPEIPYLLAILPNSHEQSEVQIPGVVLVAVVIRGHDGGTDGEDLVEDVVDDDLPDRDTAVTGNRL